MTETDTGAKVLEPFYGTILAF